MYYVYLLRCSGGSLYAGITTDPGRRLRQHRGELTGGAKFTRSRRGLHFAALWKTKTRQAASRLEWAIKQLTRPQKLRLVAAPHLIPSILPQLAEEFTPIFNEYGGKTMNLTKIDEIFAQTAYVRTGGSPEELRCAEYLSEQCAALGLTAALEPFEVDMATTQEAVLLADGKKITCKGYLCAGSGEVEGPLYYLTGSDRHSLANCRGKIVMIDGYLGYWRYQDLLENGAVGFITYDGHANYADRDIDQRELRSYVSQGRKIPGVNINAKDAIELVRADVKTVKIRLQQEEYKGTSHNVVLELPGEVEETIAFTAHYDSTSLSQGAYDNMSGCVGLLHMAEYFSSHPHRYGLRFLWCGSEERGLLGSKAWVARHPEEVKKTVLNINLDMIGCIMGKFIACCTTEEALTHYIRYFSLEQGFGVEVKQDVYSSDSTPFADAGVPAVSFARIAPNNTATIHNSYDTANLMKAGQMLIDMEFILSFAKRMANAHCCPGAREMPDNMKEKLDIYLCRKRDKQ